MREAIESEQWTLRQVTASLGVATARPGDESPEEVLQRADAALYSSKQHGRNRVTHFDDVDHTGGSQHLALKRPA
jgi:diguanylate cyclase (GGDEF)-like protein